ncbi:MAG: serine hydrolase [Candidatus Limnocylindria bacterium]
MRALIVSLALVTSACAAPPAAVPLAAATPSSRPAPSASPSATPSATPVPATPAPSEEAGFGGAVLALGEDVAARVAALIEASGGEAALVVADGPAGTIALEVAADEVVLSASLYKLAVLLEAERRIEAGTLRPADRITVTLSDQRDGGGVTRAGTTLTVEEALERMITVSDNPSALALIRTLGIAAIHATLDRYGMSGQRFTSRGSVTTARTIATFFGELSRKALVSAAASDRMLARLSRQRVTDRIPAALPAGAVLGHKTGKLEYVTHDAGLIKGTGGLPIVLVILTWDTTEEKRSQLIRDITAAVYGGLTKP